MDTLFNQSLVTNNTQRDIVNVKNERQTSLGVMAETNNGFNELTILSTITNYSYKISEEDDAERDPNSNPKVATYITNINPPHKLLKNREIPSIIQGVIPPVNQTTADGVTTSRGDLHAIRTVLHNKIATGATHSTAGVLRLPQVKNWKDTSGPIPVDKNTVVIPPRSTTQVLTGTVPSASPISIGSQKIEVPRCSIIMQEARDAKPLDASINRPEGR